MPADELKFRIFIREGPREDRFWMLNWEVRNRERFQSGRIQNPQTTQPAPLTPHEVAETRRIEGITVRITNPAKTVVDCFRYRRAVGTDVAIEALRDCWRQRKATMDALHHFATIDRVANLMRPYMESPV